MTNKNRPSLGNVGRILLALYLIAAGVLILTGLDIMMLLGVLGLFAGIAILIRR